MQERKGDWLTEEQKKRRDNWEKEGQYQKRKERGKIKRSDGIRRHEREKKQRDMREGNERLNPWGEKNVKRGGERRSRGKKCDRVGRRDGEITWVDERKSSCDTP